ncbi:MAG: BolA/IbaG family iron-sulfur metabolism protein [Chloroflexaceae bacterium]|nr:BolA/IbaG family iron-sulfur metabolism protein [Chloroflexaceae bacterium]
MINSRDVEALIQDKLPDAQVTVRDPQGDGEHLEAIVISEAFAGQSKVKQHQMVYGALQAVFDTQVLHALALRTYTPDAWQSAVQSAQ